MSSAPDNLGETIMALARQGDAQALKDLLAVSNAFCVAEALSSTQRDLYWNYKEIPAMVTVSRLGIIYLCNAAEQADDVEESLHLGHSAKALAYNLASFTWPGWDEAGIHLGADDIAAGLDAARLNLRLAEEQCRPEKAKANAYWLLGAHHLAITEYEAASAAFRSGRDHAVSADDTLLVEMLDGFLLLTHVLCDPQDGEMRQKLEEAVSRLRGRDSGDAAEYANQIVTALVIFAKNEPH